MATNPPNQPGPGASLDVTGLTLADIDQRLAAVYDDPVVSRLWEAARAKLLTRPEGPTPPPAGSAGAIHYDSHTDVHWE